MAAHDVKYTDYVNSVRWGGGHTGEREQRGQNHQRDDGPHPHRQGAGAVPGPSAGHPLQHRPRGQRLFYRQPHSAGVFRRGVRFGHCRVLYPGVQRVSGDEGPEGGAALRGVLPHPCGAAHRGPHPGGNGLSPAPGGPLRRLLRWGHRRAGRLPYPGDVPYGAVFRGGLLAGRGAPGPGPLYRPRPYVRRLEPGDYRILLPAGP